MNLLDLVGTRILAQFPHVQPGNHWISSPETADYNCIAWAAGDTQAWWWPVPALHGFHWPAGVARETTLQAFISAFETLGYRLCQDATLEDGVEKVAIYIGTDAEVTHAARQLASGTWTSKLGKFVDIEHTSPAVIEGPSYGHVAAVTSRPRQLPGP